MDAARVGPSLRHFVIPSVLLVGCLWSLASFVTGNFFWWKPERQWVARVAGPSMSPTFWGPTRIATCPACDWSHRVHLQPDPSMLQLRCFRCGALGLQLSQNIAPGELVEINPQAYRTANPQRDDCVVVQLPDGSGQVKRVIGVPGDVVKIDAAGQLWVNGQPFENTPQVAWQRAIEVYHLEDLSGLPPRWQSAVTAAIPDHAATQSPQQHTWLFNQAQFRCQLNAAPTPWLTYHHIDVYNASRPGPIRDDNPANAALAREMLPINELRLSMRVDVPRAVNLQVAVATPSGPLFGQLPLPAGQHMLYLLNHGDQLWRLPPHTINSSQPPSPPQAPQNITLSAAQLFGSRPASLKSAFPKSVSSKPVSTEQPVAIRFTGTGDSQPGQAQIDQLWLGRAARYDPPPRWRTRWQQGVRAGDDRYLVFGDNPPNSTDSRSAIEGVKRSQIQGRVDKLKTPRK
ncbi:S26 family signal peptidase [Planctomycetaceae bacterium SH139]